MRRLASRLHVIIRELRNARIGTLALASFLRNFGLASLAYVSPLLYKLGAGKEVIGIYASLSRGLRGAMGASGFLVAGRRKSLVAGYALLLTSLTLAAMALNLTLLTVMAGMLLLNALLSLFSIASSMLAASIIPPERLGSALGLFRSASTTALLVATPLFGALMDMYGASPVLLASAAALLASSATYLLIVSRFEEERAGEVKEGLRARLRLALADRRFLLYEVAVQGRLFIELCFLPLAGVYLMEELGAGFTEIGLISTVALISSTLLTYASPLLGALGSRWGYKRLYATSMILCSAYLLIASLAGSIYEFLAGVILLEASSSLGMIAALPLLSKIAGDKRDEYIAVDRAVGVLPSVTAPALGGLMASSLSFRPMLLTLAILMLAPLCAMITLRTE